VNSDDSDVWKQLIDQKDSDNSLEFFDDGSQDDDMSDNTETVSVVNSLLGSNVVDGTSGDASV
jgi:hypothetical protein